LWIGSERLLPAIRRRPFLPRRIMQSMLVRYQNWKFVRLARQAQQVIPNLRVVIVGLGRTGSFPKEFVDLRQASMTAVSERLWCAEYARSHVVLGVHGSNMLLPSALAGAVVDLLPRFKLRNITQDLIIRDEREPKLCLFRYRVLPLATRPRHRCRYRHFRLQGRSASFLECDRQPGYCRAERLASLHTLEAARRSTPRRNGTAAAGER
jgi:hypothetical protein